MNNCNMDKDILILAANKDLSLAKRYRVLKHIRKCNHCRELFREYKTLSELLKDLPEYQVAARVTKIIENKTGVNSAEPSVSEDLLSVLFFSRIKYAGLTAIVVVILAVLLFRNNYPELDRAKTDHYYSASEINSANLKTKQAFALLGKFLNKTQDQIGTEILGKKVSKPLNKGINTVNEIFNYGDKNENN